MDASFVSRARVLILVLLVAFLIACSQVSAPTLVPTIALLPTQAPTPLPEPTSAPTPCPSAGKTSAPDATAMPTVKPAACDCSGDFYDCAYFRSQGEAQGCFDYCLPRTGDVHKLDEDGDGVVCPSLP